MGALDLEVHKPASLRRDIVSNSRPFARERSNYLTAIKRAIVQHLVLLLRQVEILLVGLTRGAQKSEYGGWISPEHLLPLQRARFQFSRNRCCDAVSSIPVTFV